MAPNRLATEKSPYLLQHAQNPVDWYPWGEEAFTRAAQDDRPIFLSIGYSTCHWCHVMERESFEDEEVAALLNETFVCIKVDREERPDIDSVYMTVCQAVTGSGGWPLTIIMTPGKRPFFAGTYLPKLSRFGQMGLLELIPSLQEYWRNERKAALEIADRIVTVLQEAEPRGREAEPGEETLRQAFHELVTRYDANRGGFGRAPKFPTPHNLGFLLRYWRRSGEARALEMVERTLQAMRHGGIYDQVGFGLHRYSTDAKWLVPHFEKMLYDQALLCLAALEAYQATGDEQYAQIARDTLTYVLRDLRAPEGGFYSAEDADSEGVEGKFYVWTEAEVRGALPADLAELVIETYGVHADGSFRDEATGEATGANILHLSRAVPLETAARLEEARQILLTERKKRVRPGLDDKVLTDWNGLMIAAVARAAQVLDEPSYAEAAQRAAEFVQTRLRDAGGQLLHRYRDGEAAVPAYLDDHAFLTWGLLELYELTFQAEYLRQAVELTERMLADFWDEDNGGFYLTGPRHETLLVRQKEVYDGAVPSGNSAAMLNLLRLARLTARAEFGERAADLARAFARQVKTSPSSHTLLLWALDFAVGPAQEVVLAGERREVQEMLAALRREFLPSKVVLLKTEELASVAPYVAAYEAPETGVAAYVCQRQSCSPPVTTADELMELLTPTAKA